MADVAKFGMSHEILALAPGYSLAAAERAAAGDRDPGVLKYGFDRQVAVVQLLGVLTKGPMVRARDEIRALARDAFVREIVLLVDSPGGTVNGTHDLSVAVAAAAKVKPVTAFIEDVGCSGAYYAVCGASRILTNPTGLVGSIGVYQVIVDASRALEAAGVDVLVVRSGQHKGAGEWGAKITAEQIANIQQRVNAVARLFVAAVAKGRRMGAGRVEEFADGRVMTGVEAQAAGLVDGIGVFEDVLEQALALAPDRYVRLSGHEAVAKFEELVAKTGVEYGKHLIAGKYPELAAAAEAEIKRRYDEGIATRRYNANIPKF